MNPEFGKPLVITFTPGYITEDLFSVLRDEVAWVNRKSPRDECFMADEGAPRVYSYGNNNLIRTQDHTYNAVDMHPQVRWVLRKLNRDFGTSYNVCVLNFYKDRHQHLGWHADDSPEQDLEHPIAVIAFGAERYLYAKEKSFKGEIPDSNKYLMTPGGLLVMPGGYQANHYHRIPKHDRECGGRISLTFRKLDH
jgi:alkylated DNA repair dioxygenase AlkB